MASMEMMVTTPPPTTPPRLIGVIGVCDSCVLCAVGTDSVCEEGSGKSEEAFVGTNFVCE